jgi:hypothetical protein
MVDLLELPYLENLTSMENISVALHGSLRSAAVHFKVGGVLNKDHVATSGTHTVDDPIELKSPVPSLNVTQVLIP